MIELLRLRCLLCCRRFCATREAQERDPACPFCGGVCPAPGYRQTPNIALREAFLASGVSASQVACRLGWMARGSPDTSRVRRTLGLMPDSSLSGSYRRSVAPATFSKIAEAINVIPAELGQ